MDDLMYYGNGTTWLREDGWAVYRIRTRKEEETRINFNFITKSIPVSKGVFSPVSRGQKIAVNVLVEYRAIPTSVKFLGVYVHKPDLTPKVQGIEVLDRW